MKTIITAVKIVLKDFFKTIGSVIFLMISLLWLVSSGIYLLNIFGEWVTSGKLLTLSELDNLGTRAITYERLFQIVVAIFWLFVILYLFIIAIKKKKTKE